MFIHRRIYEYLQSASIDQHFVMCIVETPKVGFRTPCSLLIFVCSPCSLLNFLLAPSFFFLVLPSSFWVSLLPPKIYVCSLIRILLWMRQKQFVGGSGSPPPGKNLVLWAGNDTFWSPCSFWIFLILPAPFLFFLFLPAYPAPWLPLWEHRWINVDQHSCSWMNID